MTEDANRFDAFIKKANDKKYAKKKNAQASV